MRRFLLCLSLTLFAAPVAAQDTLIIGSALEKRVVELEMRVCGETPCVPGKPAPLLLVLSTIGRYAPDGAVVIWIDDQIQYWDGVTWNEIRLVR